jgi:hypothetical protein
MPATIEEYLNQVLDSRKTQTGSGKGPFQVDVLKTARESTNTLVDIGPIHRIIEPIRVQRQIGLDPVLQLL